MRRERLGGDRGSALLLGMGLVVVAILAVAVLADVSAALLQRQRLLALADASALVGAQAIDLDLYYAEGATGATRLEVRAVTARVEAYLSVHAPGIPGLVVDRIWSDGTQVAVALSGPLDLHFSLGPDGRIDVESSARLAYRDYAHEG